MYPSLYSIVQYCTGNELTTIYRTLLAVDKSTQQERLVAEGQPGNGKTLWYDSSISMVMKLLLFGGG
jgi:hypothetical protein